MSVTAKEIAERLQISAAAVSMALNGKRGVSEQTRQQVLTAAKEMGYDFSRISGKAVPQNAHINFIIYRRQGAVVDDTPFFAQLSEGIQTACRQARLKLEINYMFFGDHIERQLQDIVYGESSGVILLGTEITKQELDPFLALPIPLVILDVDQDTVRRDCVLINNNQGAFLATDYLIGRIHQQPGYLHSSYFIHNFEERADGFYRAVRHNGMSASKSIVHSLTPSVEGAYADMTEILKRQDPLARGYFADNDLIAVGAMRALQEQGYRIPEDVAIIGFDNVPLATYVDPPLTTVHVPKQYMGEIATQRLTEIMNSKSHCPVKIEIGTQLIRRTSC